MLRRSLLLSGITAAATSNFFANFACSEELPAVTAESNPIDHNILDDLIRLASGRPSFGKSDARLTIFGFGDFTCPYTRAARVVVFNTLNHRGDVKFSYFNLPLDVHGGNAALAAICYESACARYPEKALAFSNALFDNQAEVAVLGAKAILQAARSCQIDLEILADEAQEPTVNRIVRADILEARRLGFNSTPTFVINKSVIRGVPTANQIEMALS